MVQLVGHLTVNEDGEGSNPSAPANFSLNFDGSFSAPAIHLKPFRQQFCGTDQQNCGFFDFSVGEKFVELDYQEATAR